MVIVPEMNYHMKVTKRQLRRIIRETVESISHKDSGQISVFEFSSNVEMRNARLVLNQEMIHYDKGILRVEVGGDGVIAENALFNARVRFRKT